MRFKTKLSTKQYRSIFYIIIGIFLLFVAIDGGVENKTNFLLAIAGVMIINSIITFFEEIAKRNKIKTSSDHENYDSNEEKQVAEFFKKRKIIFQLHPVLKLPKTFLKLEIPFRYHKLHPDFYLPEYDVFVEYWGMIGNEKYKEKVFKPKKKLYKENAIELIDLYPRNIKNLDRDFNQKLLEIIRDREGNSKEWR